METHAISASGATEAQTIKVLKRLRIVFAGGCPCNRDALHTYQTSFPCMNWVGAESSRSNMVEACKVLQHWLDDTELVVVAVPGMHAERLAADAYKLGAMCRGFPVIDHEPCMLQVSAWLVACACMRLA